MQIKKMNIKDIKVSDYNPRVELTPNDPEFKILQASMGEFSQVEPLVYNEETDRLISGHQRKRVAEEMGLKELYVSVVRLSPEKEKKLNLILNKVRGQWDWDRLATVLKEMSEIPNFDIELTGFSNAEVSEILDEQLNGKKEEGEFDPDEALKAIEKAVTQTGDVVQLGQSRVMCGDSTSIKDMKTLFGKEKIDLVDLDYPYNVNLNGGDTPRNDTRPKNSRKWERIYSDDMPQAEYEDFMKKVLVNIKRFLKPGGAFYQWQAHKQLVPLYKILMELDFHVSCLICWKKESAAISYADYSFQTEQAVYGWLKGASHYFAGSPGESNLWEVKRDPTKLYVHPCQKALPLAERAIKNSSKRGEVVFDAFLGSGSVLIACEALDRRCFGMELDPKYVDVIVRRYIAFVGEDKVPQELKDKYLKGVSK